MDLDEQGGLAFAAARAGTDVRRALQYAIDAAAHLARSRAHAPPHPSPSIVDRTTKVSFVVCSITPAKLERVRASIARQFGGHPWELVHVGDARGLAEGYARGAQRASGEVIVFCHDDVALVARDFRARLLDHLARHDVVGVAGTTKLSGYGWFWSGPPHIHYWLTHPGPDGAFLVGLCGAGGPVVPGAQALDGVFIAVRRAVLDIVAWDATNFDGFHLYDIDFSYRAHRAGLSVAIANDLLLVHESGGVFADDYRRYAARFGAKHPEVIGAPEAAGPLFFGALVDDEESVRRTYDWIAHWAARAVTSAPTS